MKAGLCIFIVAVVACTVPGRMNSNGHIEPCGGFHTNADDCGRAIFNAPLLPRIALGMTKDDVLAIMRHPAERHDVAQENGHTVETWTYMQNYEDELMTAIIFTDGKVTAIKTVPWQQGK